jgi:hypothetical protein
VLIPELREFATAPMQALDQRLQGRIIDVHAAIGAEFGGDAARPHIPIGDQRSGGRSSAPTGEDRRMWKKKRRHPKPRRKFSFCSNHDMI